MSDVFAVPGSASRLDRVLHDLLRRAPELEAAAVVSFDGLPMASALPPGFDEDRVAAMSAALLSLGERASQGLGRGSLNQVYVEGEEGTVFLVSADDEAVLVAVGAVGAKVGLLLFEVRRGALAVAETLRHEELPEVQGYVSREVTAPLPVHVAGHDPDPLYAAPAPSHAAVIEAYVEAVEAHVEAVEAHVEAVEAHVEAVEAHVEAAVPVHTPSYSNLPVTPSYPTYDGQPAFDEADDVDALPVGEVPPLGAYEEPYLVSVPTGEAAYAEDEPEDEDEPAPAPAPTSELGSWATFTPAGSLSAPNGQGLDPWI
jgi:uncharacterized protein